jgi:hypothetical protein
MSTASSNRDDHWHRCLEHNWACKLPIQHSFQNTANQDCYNNQLADSSDEERNTDQTIGAAEGSRARIFLNQ